MAGCAADGAVAPVFGKDRAARAAGSGTAPGPAPLKKADEEQQKREQKKHAQLEGTEQAEAAQGAASPAIALIVVGEDRQGRANQGQWEKKTFHRGSPDRPQKGQKR